MILTIDTVGQRHLLALYATVLMQLDSMLPPAELDGSSPANQRLALPPNLPVPAGTPLAQPPIDANVNPTPPAVDSKGFPWDERIHSSSKQINAATGTWRGRRGVTDQIVTAVEAELRARVASGGQAPQAAAVILPPGGLTPLATPGSLPPVGAAPAATVAAPVTLPVPMPTAAVGVPGAVASVPGGLATLPVPGTPVAAVPAAAKLSQEEAHKQWNELILKWNRLSGERQWPADVFMRAVTQSGCADPNQLLASMPERITLVSMTLDEYATTGVK